MKVLYITYFGLLKHLCRTQVIPYLEGLAADGLEITVLSFEERLPDPAEERRQKLAIRQQLAAAGIAWIPLRYHKRPSLPATAYDVAAGTVVALYLALRGRVDVVHARNHVPGVIGLTLKTLTGSRLVFDMRGVMAEEYVDAGTWKPGGLPFRITKAVERRLFRRADAIIMLTRKIRDALMSSSTELQRNPAPIEIIPCCVDLEKYDHADRDSARRSLEIQDKLVLAYVGHLTGWYLADDMARFFATLSKSRNDAHFLVLTQSPHALVTNLLKQYGIAPRQYTLMTVAADEVPRYLAAADFAISFIKPCFSKLSSSPTKIGEYLASGLPVVANRGIGDLDDVLGNAGVGVLVNGFDERSYQAACREILSRLQDPTTLRQRCRKVGAEQFALATVGRTGYRRVYQQLGWSRAAIAPATTDGSNA